uniref:FMRFamide-like peptide 11 n=1 Tax=Radopholus similis TaxID=46012 RepID=B6RD35_RADSI|nr:FMRFamide-like peptide 11 [Radopholus similis]
MAHHALSLFVAALPRPGTLLLLLVCAAAVFDCSAEAMTWKMRTDKKAMRNALVRFGKRNAYRPAGEAFVGASGSEGGQNAYAGSLMRGVDGLVAFYNSAEQPIWRLQRRALMDNSRGGVDEDAGRGVQ